MPTSFVSHALPAVLLALTAGCKTTAAGSTVPTWDNADPGDDEIAQADGEDAVPVVAPDAYDAEAIGEPVSVPASSEATDAEATGAEATGATPAEPVAGATSAKAVDKPPLPKAIYSKVNNSCGKDAGVGQRLKGFKLKTTKGKAVSNRSYGSRVLLVNFWGTWCKPCLKELPEFDRLYRRYRKHGLTLVAIATDEDPEPVQEFVDRRRLAARVLIGGEDYAGHYASPKFPFTFVVDSKGVIRASYVGYKPECMGKLEADIRKQLDKRNGKS